MAKNKVINTVLNLRDNMSGGLLKAAKNAQKSNKQITNDMISATRQVVAFKNKAVDGIKSFAKTAAGVGVAGATALTTAFIALDGATEEYRIAQGKLTTAYEAAGYSAQTATQAYRDFYGILGDTDTATEASQLLSELVENEKDISTWTRIAAGVHGKWGNSIPIEGLIEASNETVKVGQVTGQLADALNWAGIMEDDFNEKLSACRSESERYNLVMDTLAQTYEGAADAFYRNNEQLVASHKQQAALQEMTAGLGATSADVKSKVLELFGAMADGTVRPGSALDWLSGKAEQFTAWVDGLDLSSLATQFDQGFATAVDKAGQAFNWVQENGDTIISVLKTIAAAWGIVKVLQFTSGVINATTTIFKFGKTVMALVATNPIVLLIGAAIAAGALLIANWDKVKKWAGDLWNKVKETFTGIKDSIVGAFEGAKDKISGFFSWLDDKIESIPILGSVYKGGKALVGGAADFIGSLIGGNALGTSYWRGGLTRVNERGGEILNLPSGTQIIPHDVSKRVAGGQTVQVYVTVQGNIIGNRQYADELGETIVQRILRALDNM